MLYNDDFLLLHYPKTAGKSVTVYFCANFDKPIHGNVSPGQIKEIGLDASQHVHLNANWGHDNFKKATTIFKQEGRNIWDLKAVLLPIRNPYDLVVSNYYFLRQTYESNPSMRDRPAFALAAESTFAEYCAKGHFADFDSFMPPPDRRTELPVELIHFETLAESLSSVAARYGVKEVQPLPFLNASKRPKDFGSLYDEESKHHIDTKLAGMFAAGEYEKKLPT